MNVQTNRRGFLKLSALLPLAAAFGAQVLTAGQKVWAEALALVDMTKTKRKDPVNEAAVGVLIGMGYVENAEAAEKAGKLKRVDKGPIKAANQHCVTCVLIKDEYVNGTKPGECKVAPGVLVHAMGYCNTYNPHPKAKT